jgi:hypothetical protein
MGSPYRFAPRAATMIAGTASAITALATFAVANLTLAAPARAETPTMGGTYAAHVDTDNETWTATPCGPGCADITFGTHGSARARLVGARWVMDSAGPSAWQCTTDGSIHAGVQHYSWDANTLQGTMYITHTEGGCGWDAGSDGPAHTISLTKQS